MALGGANTSLKELVMRRTQRCDRWTQSRGYRCWSCHRDSEVRMKRRVCKRRSERRPKARSSSHGDSSSILGFVTKIV